MVTWKEEQSIPTRSCCSDAVGLWEEVRNCRGSLILSQVERRVGTVLRSTTLQRKRKLQAKLRVKGVITGKSDKVATYVNKMAQTDLRTLAG